MLLCWLVTKHCDPVWSGFNNWRRHAIYGTPTASRLSGAGLRPPSLTIGMRTTGVIIPQVISRFFLKIECDCGLRPSSHSRRPHSSASPLAYMDRWLHVVLRTPTASDCGLRPAACGLRPKRIPDPNFDYVKAPQYNRKKNRPIWHIMYAATQSRSPPIQESWWLLAHPYHNTNGIRPPYRIW